MKPGGFRGLQSRCEARRTSRMCSIRMHLRHFTVMKQAYKSFAIALSLIGLFAIRIKGFLKHNQKKKVRSHF